MSNLVIFQLGGSCKAEYNRFAVDISRIQGIGASGPDTTNVFIEGFDAALQVKGSFDYVLDQIEEVSDAPVHDSRT